MDKTRVAFIIPHFGKFNNYFQLFLNSVQKNPDYNWIIFTDDVDKYNYPKNVSVNYMTFFEFKELVQSKFEFEISLNYAYRIADFRPAFGYIFSDYLDGYDFWGYGDSDIILGNISSFWGEFVLESVDKIGMYGHLTLIRNEQQFREAFKEPINGIEVYKKVFTENKNHSFDEEFNNSINVIFLNKNYKINFTEYQANTYTKSSNLLLTFFNFETKKYNIKKEKNLFIYRDGKVVNVQLGKGNEIIETEYLYVHFQSRKMKQCVNNYEYYKMIPNSFEDIQNDLTTQKGLLNEKKKHFNLHYFKLRTSNLIKKIKKRVKTW